MIGKRWLPMLAGILLFAIALAGCLGDETPDDDSGDETPDPAPVEESTPAEPNEAVSGMNNGCLDYMALYEVGGVDSPVAEPFDVEEGTNWEASGTGDGVHVEFFAGDGAWIGHGDDKGVILQGATYAIACAVDAMAQPIPDGEWNYQDGLGD